MISEKLMMALFSLDAYSRSTPEFEDDVRIFDLGGELSALGGATVTGTWNVPDSSFAAVAYSWNGKTIISFRGTDNPLADLWSGWTLGAGWDWGSQAKLAQDVYTEVTGKSPFAYAGDDVILTGHSLGGGLAGYLSALNGTKAYGFDHMTFGPAAAATLGSHLASLGIYDPTAQQLADLGLRVPSADNFISSHVEGEILVGVRDGSIAMAGAAAMYAASLSGVLAGSGIGLGYLLQAMASAQSQYEANVQNGMLSTYGWSQTWLPDQASELGSGFARHSQGLMVLLSYATDQVIGGQWASSGFSVPLISALYDDNIALSAGINSGEEPGLGISGKSNPADLMLTKIAYSVLDEGNRPFGDSAIRSLFNDAESVGDFLNNGGNSLLDVAQVADNIARFAALQAQHAVIGQHDGFVSHSQDMLLLDYTNEAWTFGGHVQTPARIYRDFSNFLQDGRLNATERAELDLGPNRFDAEYYSNAAGGLHGTVAFESSLYTVKSVGTSTHDTIVGTNGDEQILLAGGNDTVTPNGGVNWIDGGDLTDTLIDEHAWSDFHIHFDAVQERYYFALRASGADPRIHIVDNVELFELDGELFHSGNLLNVGPNGAKFSARGLFYEGVLKAGEEVARLDGIDGNEFDTFTWTLHPDTLVHYYLDGNIVRAREDITFDYESYVGMLGAPIADLAWGVTQETWWQQHVAFMQSAYVVKVTVKDSYGIAASTDLVVGVVNVNEAPDGLRLKNPVGADLVGYATLSENVPIGTLIMTASARDDDGDEIVWSLIEDGQGRFRIDPNTGDIFVDGTLDYETLGSLELVARATDAHGAFNEVALNITLTDVAEGIDGTSGDDILHGTIGADVINGFGGKDTMYGHEANDRLYGGANDDTFYGGTGSDAMFGDGENDTFHLGETLEGDVDYVNGGAGTGDIVQLSVGAKYKLDSAGAAAIRSMIVPNGFTAPTGHGVGIEMEVGDAFVQAVETFKAAAADNELHIGKITDIVLSGAKTFDFTTGSTDIAYLDGSDRYYITLSGNGGRSSAIQSNASAVTFLGVDEWNLAGFGSTVVVDKSHLGTQTVTFNGNGTIDILDFQNWTTDLVYGLAPLIGGTNVIANGFERIYGGSGNDTFHGTDGDDVFLGFGGTNTFYGSLGADNMTSSGGNLIVDYSLSAAKVLFNWGSGTSAVASSSTPLNSMGRGDTLSATGWSEVKGSAHDDTLVAVGTYGTLRSNGGNDTLIGGSGNDTFYGADGHAEVIRPGDGNDVVHFGTGGGTLDFSTSTRAAVIDMVAGDYIFGDQEDTVTGEYSKIVGTQFGDRIEGTDGADNIDGGSGTGYDVLYGHDGDDTITFRRGVAHGGEGNDAIKALDYNAIIFGEGGDDTITGSIGSLIYGGDNNDTITAFDGSTVHGDDGDDTITLAANAIGAIVHGGRGGDTITFNDGYSRSTLSYEQSDAGVTLTRNGGVIVGTGGHAQGDKVAGTFTLLGSAFDDVFDYQVSNFTTIRGDAGNDTISIRGNFNGAVYGGHGNDTITLFGGDTGHGDAGNDIFYGTGRMYGGADDDDFYLGEGGGTVWGGTGTNYIEGGTGNDTIYMNEGADTFVRFANGGLDLIYGAGADDHIALRGIAGFNSLADVQANLFNVDGRPELHFAGNMQKIGFIGMSMEQVLALDWVFA